MEENVKMVVDSIIEVINASETYSFKENPAPILNILLKKWEQEIGFLHTDLSNGLQNRWKKFIKSDLNDSNYGFLTKVEDIINVAIGKDKLVLRPIIIDLVLRNNIDDERLLSLLIDTVRIILLWQTFCNCEREEYVYADNPALIIRMLVEQYFACSGKNIDNLTEELKIKWDNICGLANKSTYKFSGTFDEELGKFNEEQEWALLLDAALFFVKRYQTLSIDKNSHNRPALSPWELESFIYDLKLENIASNLWNIVSDSYTYSFKKEPLPVFRMLVDYYVSNHSFESEIPDKWKETLDELRQMTQSCIDNTAKGLFDSFKDVLSLVKSDEILLAKIVDFFVDKYREFHAGEGGEYVIPESLINFIYWTAVGSDGCTTELALYNPFAGLASYGKTHAENLCSQLAYEIKDAKGELDEEKSLVESYKESAWYHGVESDQINRLIGGVRLFVNNPPNLNQMYIYAEDSFEDETDGFTGGWTFIATPPIASIEMSAEKFVNMVTKLFDKFIKAEGMSDAYFVLPKSFCYDKAYKSLRYEITAKCILRKVIDLPKEIFKNSMEAVVIHLNKHIWYFDNNTLFCDARTLHKGSHMDCDKLLDITLYGESSPHCMNVEYNTISQYGYCLLPELYIPKNIERLPGEILIRLEELVYIAKGEECNDKEWLYIADKCFRNDFRVLFENVSFDQRNVEAGDTRLMGEYIVLTFMRNKFLISKTLQDSSFYLKSNQVAFKVKNTSIFSLDYIISAILRNGILDRVSLAITGVDYNSSDCISGNLLKSILRSEILVSLDRPYQDNIIAELKSLYDKEKLAEEEAEKKRFAHREASSDISHMLGTTFDRIGDCITELKDNDDVLPVVMQIKDCFDYMKRFINTVGQNFSDLNNKNIRLEKKRVNDFLNQYCIGWKNYGKNTFEVEYESLIDDDTTITVNDVLVKVLLDTLLDNVYRHGFDRFKSINHKVKISTSYVSMDDKKYILLSVANNGNPFPIDFSIERYISRGEFYGDTGRTGLGGNHVYNIAKSHNGFINITSNDEWSVIVEILLPITYYNDSSIDKFKTYERAKECL